MAGRLQKLSCWVGLVLLAGCSSAGQLTVTPSSSSHASRLKMDFPTAVITSPQAGEYDVILINDPADQSPPPVKGVLQPIHADPVMQAITLHIHWKPTSSSLFHEAVIANATLDWYILGGRDGRHYDLLQYHGAAYVMLDSTPSPGETVELSIKDGQMTLERREGDMRDVLGPSVLSGSVSAIRNDRKAAELQAALRDRVAGARPGDAPMPAEGRLP